MNENKFTEKESLELISKMIQQTKQNLQVGSGNMLLYYGYTSVIISIVVYVLCSVTSNMYWHSLWFILFIPIIFEKSIQKKRETLVITYTDKAVGNVWRVINSLFILTVLTIFVMGMFTKIFFFIPMLPLSLLYVGIGTACTGVITNEKSMTYFPVISFVISIYMLIDLLIYGNFSLEWDLLGGLSFLLMLVIPGHILNYKSLKQCSKN